MPFHIIVVARDELALVNPQFTVEEMQLFYARMRMRGVTRTGREAGAPGAGDERVWSETGCTCVLITSTKDTLR